MSIPLQSDCDPTNPEEHFLWALVGLPGPGKHAPLMIPSVGLRPMSQRLWDLGYRHHPELQTLKFVPPASETSWIAGAAGRWAPIDEVLPAEVTAPDTSGLTMEEKRVVLERLEAELNPPTNTTTEDMAQVHHD